MKQILEPLNSWSLTNIEAGQLIRRHLSDLSTISADLLADEPFNNYVQQITNLVGIYEAAVAHVRKNEETDKIKSADEARDKAVYAFGTALKLYSLSDKAAEVEASRTLNILFNSFKNIARLNYEAETLAIDKLTSELTSNAYKEKINSLRMTNYVARLVDTNSTFKNLFGGRMVSTASTESFNMKTVRTELQNTYNDFTDYVLSMAKATDKPLFV